MANAIGNQHFVPYSKVSLTHGLPIPYSLNITPPPFCRLDLASSMGGGGGGKAYN